MSDSEPAEPFEEPRWLYSHLQYYLMNFVVSFYYRRYFESLGLKGDERVLEYGSGAGGASRHLARILSNGHLTCVDISKVWMPLAKKATRKYRNIDYINGDIADMDVKAESYDAIFIHFVLHDIPANVRSEKSRILVSKLKKGGRVYLREPVGARHGMPAGEIRAIMAACGLSEISSAPGRSPEGLPTFQGIYLKSLTF